MNAASSKNKISPPLPRNVFDAAGYEFIIDLRPPHPARLMTRTSALDLRISSFGTQRDTKPFINSSIYVNMFGGE